jgi:hypothetical protein
MAVPSATIQNVARVGVREDLSDKIAELFPDDCPFINMIGTSTAKSTYTEWQTDGARRRLGHQRHHPGRRPGQRHARQHHPRRHLHADFQEGCRLLDHRGSDRQGRAPLGTGARDHEGGARASHRHGKARFGQLRLGRPCGRHVAGLTAGALAWLTTNSVLGVAGSPANGGFSAGIVAAATNGTQRTYTETLLKGNLQTVWAAGGNPQAVITDGPHKQLAAAFTGLATCAP